MSFLYVLWTSLQPLLSTLPHLSCMASKLAAAHGLQEASLVDSRPLLLQYSFHFMLLVEQTLAMNWPECAGVTRAIL